MGSLKKGGVRNPLSIMDIVQQVHFNLEREVNLGTVQSGKGSRVLQFNKNGLLKESGC